MSCRNLSLWAAYSKGIVFIYAWIKSGVCEVSDLDFIELNCVIVIIYLKVLVDLRMEVNLSW